MTDRIVAVDWDDAHVQATDSFTKEEIRERVAVRYTTFGLLVREDEKIVAIAAEICSDGGYRGVTYIPRGMVVGITSLGCWPKKTRSRKQTHETSPV